MRKRYFGSVERRPRRVRDTDGSWKTDGTFLPGYWVRWTDAAGRRHLRRAGSTRKAAEDLLLSLQGEREAALARKRSETGEGPGEPGADATAGLTLRSLTPQILETWKASLSEGTMKFRPFALRRWARRFGDTPVTAITQADVQRAVNSMRMQEGYAPTSVRSEVGVLASAFRVLRRDLGLELAVEKPCRDLSLPKVQTHAPRHVAATDLDELLKVSDPRIRGMVAVSAGAGLRPAELFRLRWSEVVEGGRALLLTRTKTYSNRPIPLGARAVAALTAAREAAGGSPGPDEVVFEIGEGTFWKLFRRASKDARLRDPQAKRGFLTPYGLRHAFASGLLREKVPVSVVRDLMGHANLRTTDRYLRSLPPDAAREAIKLLAEARGENAVPKGPAGT
jgi:integrase